MNPHHTARGILMENDQLLLIERWREGLHYFSIPGGGIERGEEPQQTVLRELLEETSITVEVQRLLYEIHESEGAVHSIFLCSYISGEPALAPDSEEAHDTALGVNRFKPGWVPLARLPEIHLKVWEPVRHQLLIDLTEGFSQEVKMLSAPSDDWHV